MPSCCRWLLLLLCFSIGCRPEKPVSTTSNQETSANPQPTALIKVKLALNWLAEAEHGGYYAALVHGYFAEEGLDVEILPGGPKAPVIANVADGRYEFGVDNADKILLARQQQADVVVVMAPIQNSPRCIMVHKKNGLKRLEDLTQLKKFTLSINTGQPFSVFLKKKLNLDNIQVVPYGGNIAAFLEDENYGQQAYSFSEPFVAEKRQSDPQCLMLSDLGFNTYTSVLLTRREMLEKQSEIVAKMTSASIRGWKKYLADPEESNRRIHQDNSEMGLEILDYGAKNLKPLCLPDGLDENRLGEMKAERWQTLVTQMGDIGLIKLDQVKPDDVYTLKYLTKKIKE